jgi:hypothetical protein
MSDEFRRVQQETERAQAEAAEIERAKKEIAGETIPRVWQDKKSGELVEVTAYQYVIGGARRVVFTGPGWGHESALARHEFERRYRPFEDQDKIITGARS